MTFAKGVVVGNSTVAVVAELRGISFQEDGNWIAGFPQLDLYSSGDTEAQARESAKEALRLWMSSCLDRGTLDAALQELGWHRMSGSDHDAVIDGLVETGEVRGESWTTTIRIPAFQASAFLQAGT